MGSPREVIFGSPLRGGRTLHVNDASGFENRGAVALEGTSTTLLVSGNYTQTAGSTRLDGGLLSVAGSVGIAAGTLLSGSGTVGGQVFNSGVIRPGGPLGALLLNGQFTQHAAGTLEIEVGGAAAGAQHDLLAAQGAVQLGGTLNVATVNGFVPAPGQRFEVVTTAATRSEAFAAVNGLSGAGFTYQVAYEPQKVALVTQTPPGARALFTSWPVRAASGYAFGLQPAVKLVDSGGAVRSGDNSTVVTLTLAAGDAGVLTCDQTSGGVTSMAVSAGMAAFTGCRINLPGAGYALRASATDLADALAPAFSVTLAGDVNGDCRVSPIDFSTVVTYFNLTSASAAWLDPARMAFRADLNGDGAVSALDYSILVSQFGATAAACPAASNVAPAPVP